LDCASDHSTGRPVPQHRREGFDRFPGCKGQFAYFVASGENRHAARLGLFSGFCTTGLASS
jgi:hypothetical protein